MIGDDPRRYFAAKCNRLEIFRRNARIEERVADREAETPVIIGFTDDDASGRSIPLQPV